MFVTSSEYSKHLFDLEEKRNWKAERGQTVRGERGLTFSLKRKEVFRVGADQIVPRSDVFPRKGENPPFSKD